MKSHRHDGRSFTGRAGSASPWLAGWALAALTLAGPAQAQSLRVVELATLAQGTALVVRGPNGIGAAVGGGRLKQGDRLAALRQGLLFETSGPVAIAGLQVDEFTTVFGINDAGQLAGSANTDEAVRAFTSTRNGAARELPPLSGDTASFAYALNNRGEVVGYSSGAQGERAVAWVGGTATALPVPAGLTGRAMSINDRGDIAGVVGALSQRRAALWRGGTMAQSLQPLQALDGSEAVHVNGRGDVVGHSFDLQGARRATLWPSAGGAAQELPMLPGHSMSQALGSNDAGTVVGFSGTSHATRAVLWTASGVQDLNLLVAAPGLVLTKAVGINNAGSIVAVGYEVEPGHAVQDHGHDHELPVRVVLITRVGG